MLNRVCTLLEKGKLEIQTQMLEGPDDSSVVVEMKRGGICGTDLHYYQDGGIGTIRVSEPIILGHEISGVVRELGSSVTSLSVGDKVAINPSLPCNNCAYCREDLHQHCTDLKFTGSAKTKPHIDGGFRNFMVAKASQCHRVEDHVTFAEAACAEPLAVCLHAAAQVEDLKGKSVLVTGSGPIGALCVAVAATQGAKHIVVTDLSDFTLAVAKQMGSTFEVNVAKSSALLSAFVEREGQFDVAFECSAAKAAIATAIDHVKPRGTIVLVGSAGETAFPLNVIVGKELNFKGTFRFHHEFAQAVKYLNDKALNVAPLITQTFPLEDAEKAMHAAADRGSAMKVQLMLDQD
ncbi:L-idonate 5-dehydrogenase [Thalassovita autumnalis]|uniref:L-idonate 5-dehydrogenase n=1 Tax=Thalassovita autumnalis TaxID=2072972 RepID=A0A0P1FNL4_9RHOB|nr:L-idonate 5-dehydrogenase [Thalassovita autumnalis]CUH69992.1 L-idonate 5-dehydrogenase [Thalassovita autumnalis]CUH72378.1 L-idonate 5-dehydrogenase [Thalassovita autumnalis]|mmetsp:Transcript_20148/g.26418  ORF Transcript_20148/g.26418 Transcript_20148/m.26418 type:complete len:349 (+) Transcript_20148:4628-5674(+)